LTAQGKLVDGENMGLLKENDVVSAGKQDQSLDLNTYNSQMIVNNARKAFIDG
jgi:hypothetical protein